jgi:hypothetical protein
VRFWAAVERNRIFSLAARGGLPAMYACDRAASARLSDLADEAGHHEWRVSAGTEWRSTTRLRS